MQTTHCIHHTAKLIMNTDTADHTVTVHRKDTWVNPLCSPPHPSPPQCKPQKKHCTPPLQCILKPDCAPHHTPLCTVETVARTQEVAGDRQGGGRQVEWPWPTIRCHTQGPHHGTFPITLQHTLVQCGKVLSQFSIVQYNSLEYS